MFCSNCGCKNDDKAVFCKNCGSKLKKVNIEKYNNKSEIVISKKSLVIIVVSLILLITIIIAGIYFISKTKGNNNIIKTNISTVDKESDAIDKTLSKAVKAIINKDFSKLYDELYISEDIYYPKEDFVKEWNEYIRGNDMKEDMTDSFDEIASDKLTKYLKEKTLKNIIEIKINDIEKEENSKTAQVNLEIELLKVKKIEDKVEMINIDGNWKITLDSLYDLIENQESNF